MRGEAEHPRARYTERAMRHSIAMLATVLRGLRWLALLIVLVPRGGAAEPPTGVGLVAIELRDPVNGGQMEGYVFYPSTEAARGRAKLGPYSVAATVDAPAQPGAKPLVVLSHGNGGSRLDLHELASHLAGHGFVVAALDHPKDDFRDKSGAGHLEVLIGRPVQISAMITYLLADARWKTLIDAEHIGAAGFSAGGYTSLLLVGAVPAFDRIVGYCLRHRDDPVFCAAPEIQNDTATTTDPGVARYLAELDAGRTRWGPTSDPRVKAAFAMAPLSLYFDARGAGAIDRPVFLYYGEHDRLLLPSENAARIKPFIKTLAGVKVLPKADHFVFLSPCSAELARAVPVICADPPGVDRAKASAAINADALAFFRKTLAAARH
jgi:predicted dienelactone hydrolase